VRWWEERGAKEKNHGQRRLVDFKRGLEMWAVGAGRRRAAHGGQNVGGFGLATRGWCARCAGSGGRGGEEKWGLTGGPPATVWGGTVQTVFDRIQKFKRYISI
jgi:hypothetical protein